MANTLNLAYAEIERENIGDDTDKKYSYSVYLGKELMRTFPTWRQASEYIEQQGWRRHSLANYNERMP